MVLKQAVIKVIEQNKSVGYTPTRFIQITKMGDAEDLPGIICRLVLKAELLEELEKEIGKHGEVLTVEDLITVNEGGLGLPKEVIRQAEARSEWFNKLRATDNEWVKNFCD